MHGKNVFVQTGFNAIRKILKKKNTKKNIFVMSSYLIKI